MNKIIIFILIAFLIKSHLLLAESNWITKKKLDNKIEGFCSDTISIDKLNLEADKFYDDNIFNDSFKCSLIAANKGDAYAQGNVGWHYQTGNGVAQDNKKAIKWFKLGVDKDAPYSLIQLAYHYNNGLGILKDEKKGFELNMKAANQGDEVAEANIGWHYLEGVGVSKDSELALKWFKLAAEKNNAYAQANLGWMIANGEGTKKDYKKGFEWSLKAANRGSDYAQANVGWHYENGFGLAKDIEESIKWFELAAKQENEYAKEHLLNLKKEKTDTEYSSFITKKETKTITDSKNSNEIITWITKKEREEARKEVAKQKIIVEEKKKNSQIKETPILEEWSVKIRTMMLEKPDVDSKILGILKRNEKVFVRKEVENSSVIGIWFKIETEEGKAGYALKEKFKNIDDFEKPEDLDEKIITYDIEWGNYYALVIGNNNYKELPPLETPINDAIKIGEILENKYNFTVHVLPDATKDDILTSLYNYRNILTSKDNLLIYYAGHGNFSPFLKQGMWKPIGANENDWSGIKNGDIVDIIEQLQARHIIVIADSCFSGSILNEWDLITVKGNIDDMPEKKEVLKMYDFFALKNIRKARVALTSGNLEYVPDKINDSDKHSAFAKTLIEILLKNNQVMLSNELFVKIQKNLYYHDTIQEPLYGGIDTKSHSIGGQFIFVPIS